MGSILTKIIIFFIVKNFTLLTYSTVFLLKKLLRIFKYKIETENNTKKKQNCFLALFDFVICLLLLICFYTKNKEIYHFW